MKLQLPTKEDRLIRINEKIGIDQLRAGYVIRGTGNHEWLIYIYDGEFYGMNLSDFTVHTLSEVRNLGWALGQTSVYFYFQGIADTIHTKELIVT